MISNEKIDTIIEKRVSVRTYSNKPIPEEIRQKIDDYIKTLNNPFGARVNFKRLKSETAENSAKLGTYGVIKGAKEYIGAVVSNQAFGLMGLGYEFEQLILYITALGLGTCWLGGTFNRSEFARAMVVGKDDLFPIISPLGYPADKKSLMDSFFRSFSKGDSRKKWEELFFDGDFSRPLSPGGGGAYQLPLEMVRLGPSASNKQPWRIVKMAGVYHFYEEKTPAYAKAFSYDIQEIDMGIAACHFALTARETGLRGEFNMNLNPVLELRENKIYCFSWLVK